jgi:aminoglycoside phosphotransferase (APT) family kinase protein
MSDRLVEQHALRILWATMRYSFAPELSSALAKDRAKRADAALGRLIASYEALPAVRAAFAPRYQGLLDRAVALSARLGVVAGEAAAGEGNPTFIGIPGVAGRLEASMAALSQARANAGSVAADIDALLLDLVQLEATFRTDYETAAMKITPVAGRGDDRQLTVESLQRYLRAHPRGAPGVVVRKVNEIPGGRSKRTVLVELENGAPLPHEIVLRLDTGRGVGTSVVDEFPIIRDVASLDLPVPTPLWLESAPDLVGHPFIVFRRMAGAAAGDLMEGAFRKEPATGRALARVLGRVHGAGAALIIEPARRGSAVSHTQELLTHYLDYWNSKKPFPSLVIETAFMWLFRSLHDGLGEATVVHADTGFHNLLLEDSGNGCLLDWEFSHFGDPAEDLASCRPAVERCMPWADFMAEYQAAGGKPASDFRLRYFEIWRPLRNAVVCGTVLHSMMRGEADDIDPVTIGLSTFARLQADLARSLATVMTTKV